MPPLPTQVLPGELISSDLMNDILRELESLRAGLDDTSGTTMVPDVFGMPVLTARAIVLQPARQLSMGAAIDLSGQAIDPLGAGSGSRIVLNQSPAAGSRVPPGTSVNLVVSGTTTAPTLPAPKIATLRDTTGNVATSFAVGGPMTIFGSDFSPAAPDNVVTFNGVLAVATPDPSNATSRLFVTVPSGVPGAPITSTDPDLPNVIVRVQTPGGADQRPCTLTAPKASQPVLDPQPTGVAVNGLLELTGTGFSSTPSENQVWIAGISSNVESASSALLRVRVPLNIPGLNNTGDNRLVNVALSVNGVDANAIQVTVFVP